MSRVSRRGPAASMRLGMFGGAFNPVHLGHLLLAETARETLRLDRVVFIPTHHPPHKPAPDLLPGAVRLQLLRLALHDHPAFVASDIELQRPGVSYSLETVRLLRAEVPQAKLFLLMGQDMLRVPWKGWGELQRLCTVVVACRSGETKKRRARGVQWLEMPRVDIASSEIRRRVRTGRSLRYLVPPAVSRYIAQHHLYVRDA